MRSLRPFPRTRRIPAERSQVVQIQSHQFGHSKSGAVRRFQNRAISQALIAVGRRSLQQCINLFGGEKVRQLAAGARRPEWLCGVGVAQPFSVAVAKKASETRQAAGHRGAGISAFVKPCDVIAEDADFHLSRRWHRSDLLFEEFDQVIQIIRIGFDRQIRGIAFHTQIVQEQRDSGSHDTTIVRGRGRGNSGGIRTAKENPRSVPSRPSGVARAAPGQPHRTR
jgi:hypothetical protein